MVELELATRSCINSLLPSSSLLSSPLLMEQIVDFKLNYPFCSLVTLVKWASSSTKTSPDGIIE